MSKNHERSYRVSETVYLPARYSTIRNAVLTATVIGVSFGNRTATVRLANGTADVLSFEELNEAADRVARLREE